MVNSRKPDEDLIPAGLPGYIAIARRLWRQHLVMFAAAFVSLTSLFLANHIAKQLPSLSAAAVPSATILKILVHSVPYIVTITVPIAVLFAVLQVFSGREMVAMQRLGVSPMRLAAVVLAGATLVGCLAFVWNDKVLPRSNRELRILLVEIARSGPSALREGSYRGDREFGIAELRRIARSAAEDARVAIADGNQLLANAARQRAAIYAVEIQKKYAVSAACVVFALLGVGLGLRIRGGGWPLVIVVSMAVCIIEYAGLVAGEDLGDRLILSPVLAMWTVNIALAIVGCGLLWSINKSAGVELPQSMPPV